MASAFVAHRNVLDTSSSNSVDPDQEQSDLGPHYLPLELQKSLMLANTVKPALSGHSKIDKTKILMTNGSLMKVESIAECSCNTFDLN